jgi:hypothetical protein
VAALTTAFATTSGLLAASGRYAWANRRLKPSACRWYGVSRLLASALSPARSLHSVRIAPGSTITTWTPKGASSSRRLSLKPSTANFVAWYHAPSGS